VILDSGAPQVSKVNGTVSGNNLIFDWEVIASSAPVAFYEYALVPEAQVNETPDSWTKLGLQQSITIDGTGLADGNYRLIVRGCSAAGVYSRREGTIDEWGVSPKVTLDRQPPVLDESKFSYPNYAAAQMEVTVTATDELAGIGGYQYTLGSKTDPQQDSGGWVDIAGETGTIQFTVPTKAVAHAGEVYLMVRAKDQVGQWSTALVSDKIIVDHTLPTTPAVTCGGYTASLTQVNGISYQSTDPESGVTHCRWGIVKQKDAEWLVTPQETPVAEFTGILTGLTLEEGQTYYIAVQARNGAGEWSTVGYSQAVLADTIVPELTFTKAASTVVLNAPPLLIEYTLTEAANLQFTLAGADGSAQQVTAVGQAGLNYYTFTASMAQTYQLSVIPTDLAGNIGLSKSQSIRVNALPQITLPKFNITPGAALKLTATVTDLDGTAVSYQWDPGDGGPTLTEAEPTHRYYQTGTYTVKLLVTDNDGGVSTATTTVTVANTTGGSLQGDETWSGIHRIYNNVSVPSGTKLVIKAGTQIIVDGNATAGYFHALTIDGTLNIEAGGVTFTSATGKTGGWRGIEINGTANLSDVTINYAERGVTVNDMAQVSMDKVIFENNKIGLHVYNAKPTVSNSVFRNNIWYGIKEDAGGRPVVTGCQFEGNDINYYHQTLTAITIEKLNQLNGNGGNSAL
jgi:PKD repeat protein